MELSDDAGAAAATGERMGGVEVDGVEVVGGWEEEEEEKDEDEDAGWTLASLLAVKTPARHQKGEQSGVSKDRPAAKGRSSRVAQGGRVFVEGEGREEQRSGRGP